MFRQYISSNSCVLRSFTRQFHSTYIKFQESSSSSSTVTKSSIHHEKRPGTAIVLLNMGGPSTIPEVRDFLFRLFSDKDIIPLGPFQDLVAKFITTRRTPKIEEHYEEIGGGSPIRKWSEYQASEACKLLDKISPSTGPHSPYVAFRYANPLTEETYLKMMNAGITRAVAFSQYPQYSRATSKSSFKELERIQKIVDPSKTIEWTYIQRWPTHPKLVKAFAQNIEKALSQFDEEQRKEVVILFSAHSIPMDFVNSADTYPAEVAATVHAVMKELKFSNPYRLTWQSQVGPKSWLGPKTNKTVGTLVDFKKKTGKPRPVVMVPIAFTSDHIETLHELDIELVEECGGDKNLIRRAESLNGSPLFIEALADIVACHLDPKTHDPTGEKQVESGVLIKQLELDVK